MEQVLDTILKEMREMNSKLDSLLANQNGAKRSLTGIKPAQEDDFTQYVRELAKKHKQFPGLNMLTLENLQKYKDGRISIAVLLSSIGSIYSKRNSFYNFLKDLNIISFGKYNFVRERDNDDKEDL